ncbi:MAG: SRPBCC family protein [Solirubrobacterales bacterium]
MKVQHTEVLKGSADEIFSAFEDPEVIAAWQDNLLEFEQVKGSFQKKGGVAQMKVRQVGMTNDLTVTVLDRDAKKFRVKYGYEGAQAPFEIANTFIDLGDGTTEWTAVMDVKLNLLTKALGPVLKPLANELVKGNGKSFGAWCASEF